MSTTTITEPVWPLLALFAGCGAHEPDPVPSVAAATTRVEPTQVPAVNEVPDNGGPAASPDPLRLRWTLARDAGGLLAEYHVSNAGTAAVWLLDRTVIPTACVQPAA